MLFKRTQWQLYVWKLSEEENWSLKIHIKANKLCSNSCNFPLILQVSLDSSAVANPAWAVWVHPLCSERSAFPAAACLGACSGFSASVGEHQPDHKHWRKSVWAGQWAEPEWLCSSSSKDKLSKICWWVGLAPFCAFYSTVLEKNFQKVWGLLEGIYLHRSCCLIPT